jgi:tetratricopeptide (TPR) repeat protein
MTGLAANYELQGRYSEAAELYRQALADLEPLAGRNSARLLSALDSYIAVLRKLQNYAEAEKLEVRATGIRVKNTLLNEAGT